MEQYLFVDLDDTLFQTRRKLPDGQFGSAHPAAYLRDGKAISYATAKQQRLWRGLSQGFRIVPVTARSYDAFRRVDLPFSHEAVLNHGGVILQPDRRPDEQWLGQSAAAARGCEEDLQSLLAAIHAHRTETGDSGIKPRLIEDFGVFWYLVVKHESGDEQALERLTRDLVRHAPAVVSGRLYLHSNGNNLAVLPQPVNKAAAVAYLQRRFAQRHGCDLLTVGMGDSLTDAPFMALCDYAVIPGNTQLHRHVFEEGARFKEGGF
jgi:hydroxymethylpyrimidine pyrophosphatase-like HAD family hydrolase